MWERTAAILVCVGFLWGFVRALLRLGADAALESYYKATVKGATTEEVYCLRALGSVSPEVIIDSGRPYSRFRTFVKKGIARLLRKRVPPVILVFGIDTEDGRKAYVIQKAFSSVTESSLLDTEFLEAIIRYRAHKFAYNTPKVEKAVKNILRSQFEQCTYRETVVTLESIALENVVLNPLPEWQPLLTHVILPMAGEAERLIQEANRDLVTIEEYKSFFMQLIEHLCSGACAVVFIGVRPQQEYIDWVHKGIGEFNIFLLAARGSYINRMLSAYDKIEAALTKKWAPKFASRTIAGRWEFRKGQEVSCQWIIAASTRTLPVLAMLPSL